MSDFFDPLLRKLHITGTSAKALKFVLGAGVVALSLASYTPANQLIPFFGILLGGYIILLALQ